MLDSFFFSNSGIKMWILHGFMVYSLPTKVKRNSKCFSFLLINSPGRVLSDHSVCRSMEPNWTNSGTCGCYASSGLSLNTLLVSYKWISLKPRRLFQGYGAFSNELQLSYKTGYEADTTEQEKKETAYSQRKLWCYVVMVSDCYLMNLAPFFLRGNLFISIIAPVSCFYSKTLP